MDMLEELYDSYKEDPTFAKLRERGAKFIPGAGPLSPDIMLIGRSPGASENTKGRPFVGKAGIELKYLLKGADIDPNNVFMTCAIKYFTPIQQGKFVSKSFEYLLKEIEIVNPRLVGLCGLATIQLFYPDIEEVISNNGSLFDNKYVPLYDPGAMMHTPQRSSLIRRGYMQLTEHLKTQIA